MIWEGRILFINTIDFVKIMNNEKGPIMNNELGYHILFFKPLTGNLTIQFIRPKQNLTNACQTAEKHLGSLPLVWG